MEVFDLAKALILLVEEYKNADSEFPNDVNSFAHWLQTKMDSSADDESETLSVTGHSMEAELAAYIGRLSRYSNTYIKNVLQDTPFATDMEFAFTAILDGAGEVGKTDLIRMMAFDKSSGMGVIRRLLEKSLIEEFPNPQDKRGKVLRLTEKGKQSIILGYEKAPIAAKLVSSNLSANEKKRLLYLLKKLDDFHYPIYLNENEDSYLK
ncbi:MAG: winged helix DNA-binding protein [Bacteroidota bacterium]